MNGQPAAGLLVYKQSERQHHPDGRRGAARSSSRSTRELPAGFTARAWRSTRARSSAQTVDGVQDELLLAALITGVVLFFFLHSLRSTIIVLLAIPTSLLVALIVMKVLGLTLNTMTLIGLTTAIGVLVDDSIVVLENIFTHLERGKEPKQAAVDGRSRDRDGRHRDHPGGRGRLGADHLHDRASSGRSCATSPS